MQLLLTLIIKNYVHDVLPSFAGLNKNAIFTLFPISREILVL